MKPSLKIISVAFLAAAVCGALVQRSALSNVHQENEKLRGESEEVRRLARENAEIERLRAENAQIEEQFRESARQMNARFQSARIAAKRVVSAEKVELALEAVLAEDAPLSRFTVPFKRIGSEWKMDEKLF